MKIVNAGSEALHEWDLRKVQELNASFFVYSYESGSYEGTGFAVWDMEDGKYGYTYLGHCSCNGPVEDLNSIPYNWNELQQIAARYGDHAEKVMNTVELTR